MASNVGKLRELLQQNHIRFLIVPSADAHLDEYIAPQDKRRAWVSGFDGSSGTALVSNTVGDNFLWTDGRYWIQAEQQLDPKEWTLMKDGSQGVPTLVEKLPQLLKEGDKLGVDPSLITVNEMRAYKQVTEKAKAELVWCEGYVDKVWKDRLIGIKIENLTLMPDTVSGQSVNAKLQEIQKAMVGKEAKHMILSTLDEVAWLLNLRGADIPFNPVFFSFVVLTVIPNQDVPQVSFFIDDRKLTRNNVIEHLITLKVKILDYQTFYASLGSMEGPVWIDAAKSNASTYSKLVDRGNQVTIIEEASPIALLKATKNSTEIEGMRLSHQQDGAALVEFFNWLENTLNHPDYDQNPLNEYQIAEKELTFRKTKSHFVGPSFETISSTGANAAIIHYSPPKEGSAVVRKDKIYLNDSGGQYLNGTTDVTRTWHFGTPTEHEIDAYTRVLIGFIELSRAQFPLGVYGYTIDALARNALWQAGMDYAHGTGHGVGHYLNVHEAPPYIGLYRSGPVARFQIVPHMVTSIEPGYYEAGNFGCRIENVALVVPVETPTFSGKFLKFEQLTMAPICKTLINKAIMTPEQIQYLNDYHAIVRQKLAHLIHPDASAWLSRSTSPL